MGAHAYVVTNQLTSLAASVFTWSNGATTNRSYLNDGRMDKRQNIGNASSGINVIVDLGSAKQLVGAAILNCNAAVQKTDAAVVVAASSSSTFAADVNTAKSASTLYSTTAPRNKDHVLQWNANYTKQYWRLTWTWTGTVTDFSIGELFFFTSSTSLTRRSIYGSGESMEMRVAQTEMQYGETRGLFLAGPIRALNLQWQDLTASERNELQTMWSSSYGGASPLLWIASAEAVSTAAAVAEQECIYGRLEKPAFAWTENDYSLYTPDGFNLRSLGREAGA